LEVEWFLGTSDAVGKDTRLETGRSQGGDLFKQMHVVAVKPRSEILNRTKIVGYLAHKCDTPKKTVSTMFDELFKLAVKECGRTGEFVIPNIGRVTKTYDEMRMSRNPQTGEPIKIKAKTDVRLRAAKVLRDAVLG